MMQSSVETLLYLGGMGSQGFNGFILIQEHVTLVFFMARIDSQYIDPIQSLKP